MGVNNRQRRAARAKQRAAGRARERHDERSQTSWEWTRTPEFRVGAASITLRQAVLARLDGVAQETDYELFLRIADDVQQAAFDDQLNYLVRVLFQNGLTPLDLAELGRRRASEASTGQLMAVAAAVTAEAGTGATDPRWLAQLDGIAPSDGVREWCQRSGTGWPDARAKLFDLMVVLAGLPRIEEVIAVPGRWRASTGKVHGVDERVLRRVRGLLAKAESTEFEDEADALTAKAQELMTAHAIERTLAESNDRDHATPEVRRLWLDAPYVYSKALLVAEVATSNRCRVVFSGELGFVTLVGHAPDLDTVELFTTSLLLQAARAMRQSGPQRNRQGQSRTRSFRQAFLVAYGGRIGERLRGAAADTEAHADAERNGRLLPILAARASAVDDVIDQLFPDTVHRSVSVNNAAGWGAGRAAADLALFDVRDAVEQTG